MLWRRVGDWTYEYFDPDDTPAALEPFEAFIALWREKKGNRALAAWADYDWYDLEAWWGHFLITDIHRERTPFDFRYRLCGGHIVRVFDDEVTGKWASDVARDKGLISSHDLAFYEMVTAAPHIVYTHGRLDWQERPHMACGFCEVPLAGKDDPNAVGHMLSLMIQTGDVS